MRTFKLALPGDEGPASGAQKILDISAPVSLHVPRVLHFRGLAGYEPETLACFLTCLDHAPAGEFLDVGTNVGVFAWLAAALGGRQVTAFEPAPEIADWNESICRANELSVHVERLALGERGGEATLYLSSKSDCSNSLRPGFRDAAGTLTVRLDTLDTYCETRGLRPAVVKVDTETTEPAVLRGGRRLWELRRTWLICEVLSSEVEAELMGLLAPCGYYAFPITGDVPLTRQSRDVLDPAPTDRNWLFSPNAPSESFWESLRRWTAAVQRCRSMSTRRNVDAPALSFQNLGARWRPTSRPRFVAREAEKGVTVESCLERNERLHFFSGEKGLGARESHEESVAVAGGRQYELRVHVEGQRAHMPRIHLCVFQYDDHQRIRSDRVFLDAGANSIVFDTSPAATSLRIAFRIADRGHATIGAVKCYVLEET